jgi:glyoxylase-like metal-dependent hydrolase (beta-lactamase superfamily II)
VSVIGDGIAQIRLPMRDNPLRYVNAYVLEDGDGLTLIDCGWRTDDVLAALHEGLALIDCSLADVRCIAITHFHHDHYGLAATLRRAGVPALAMHAADWSFAQRIFDDVEAADHASDAWLQRNGLTVPPESDDDAFRRKSEAARPTRLLADGERIGRLRTLWTPGHSPGHLCFVDERSGRVFSGDHVLDPITPHVGMWFEDRGDPLGAYVSSLHKVAELGSRPVLPAHGEPFAGIAARAYALLMHQAEREAQVVAALEDGPHSAAAVAHAVPWTRTNRAFGELPETMQQFAVAETIAHLEHAYAGGRVRRDRAVDPILYAAPN